MLLLLFLHWFLLAKISCIGHLCVQIKPHVLVLVKDIVSFQDIVAYGIQEMNDLSNLYVESISVSWIISNILWPCKARPSMHDYNMPVSIIILQWNPSIPDTLGTAQSVLIKGGVLISGVVLYVLCSWDHTWCPDWGRCPHFRGVLIKGFHCIFFSSH
jgi:hypothetical protein